MASDPLPLDGIRVLDLTRLLPGGFCTMILADFGADVIKIEDSVPPTPGDYLRWMAPSHDGVEASAAGAMYMSLNRNKRSVQLDLKADDDLATFRKLAAEADVVIEGFRPGVVARLGVDYTTLSTGNERLIYCSLSGYGQDGPYAQRAGHDLNYLAMTGLLDLSGELDGPPIQPAAQIADIGGGALMATIGILLALQERASSGKGQFVDIAMLDGTLAWAASLASHYFCDGRRIERGTHPLRGGMISYMAYPCKDGWVTLGAIEPKFWETFCRGVDREDLIPHREDPSDGWAQGELEAIFRRRTLAEWDAFAAEHDCCVQIVLPLPDAVEHPQVRAREMIVDVDRPGGGTIPTVASPIRLSRTPADVHRLPAPSLGADTGAITRP